MTETIFRKVIRVYRGGNFFRFLFGLLLIRLGLCRFLTLKYNGMRLRFHPAHFSLYIWTHSHSYRGDDVGLVKGLLMKGDTFIDVGANIGSLTIAGAQKAGVQGRVFSFEPHPQTFRFLRENIKLNEIENVMAFNCALGAGSGEISFSNYSADDQNQIIDSGAIRVPLRNLDSIIPDVPVALLKIDVEGYEKFVLAGGKRVLSGTSNIIIEISEENFKLYGYKTRDIVEQLEENGFQCLRLSMPPSIVGPDYKPEGTENLIASKDISKLPGFLIDGIVFDG